MTNKRIALFWFRRDLRLEDNTALRAALDSGMAVQPIFIFDNDILSKLEQDDSRVSFIYKCLSKLNRDLLKFSSSVWVHHGEPKKVFEELLKDDRIAAIYSNEDYEPYAIKRDAAVRKITEQSERLWISLKDQSIFHKSEIVKKDGSPYTVFTPYSKVWKTTLLETPLLHEDLSYEGSYVQSRFVLPSLNQLGFKPSSIKVMPFDFSGVASYGVNRDIPSENGTTLLGPHLRFGTVSPRQVIRQTGGKSVTFVNQIIWRDFFMQILFHFPHVVNQNFRPKYNGINWRNTEDDFERWCEGKTGYPMVDAGMRQLNSTGYMHNRVRMVAASFLCKHLLIDWQWGEAYFASKLLDYDLASNNGNWQWAAGTGCDAAPYFRIFNPESQQKRFDQKLSYIKRWVPEIDSDRYPPPMVEHKLARERALEVYKKGIEEYSF